MPDPQSPPAGLLGSGRLRDALAVALPSVVPQGDALVVAADDAGGDYREARARGLPWLPVRVEEGWVLVGPAVHPAEPGCATCAARRRDGNWPHAAARRALGQGRPNGLLTPVLTATVAALVAGELGSGFARTRGALLRMSVRTGAITRHPLAPDPLCPDCADLPEDRPVRLCLGPSPKPDPKIFRTRPLPDGLEERYVDPETGLIGSMGVTIRGSLPTAVARLTPGRRGDDSRHGYGRAGDFRSARRTAIAEALERYAGARPRGRGGAVRARFADIAGHALDPRTLGLYPDEWYDQPGFGCTRFDPEQQARWVWGYSFAAQRPLLVPLTCAYHGTEPGWAYDCSNGAALGGDLTEAIFHGLLEIAERDAFLMTWYGMLPLPKADLNSAQDRRIPLAAARALRVAGYELMAFAMPMEQRVPAFWAMAVDRVGGPGRPHTLCAAGAHPDAEQALRSALYELLPSVGALTGRYDAEAAAAMLADPDLVREMDHHRLLYCHPDAYPRLSFLPADDPGHPLERLTDPWPDHDDLADDLTELLSRYLSTGLDVIAVETTTPELRAGGFACAKVIVPGTLPMTFGHRYRRTHGLSRPLTVPHLLGHRPHPLTPADLNPHPHPFP
ncbi:TOMM precursor leader peptide-binding protein [Nonomuraea sp. NPDC046570]|uniref:TOMM precursor leader peptide-binding protein n=1 Tax=Nonomuraea sp. NPDC046570 TaxID=3155255 RepID=UPI0033CB0379